MSDPLTARALQVQSAAGPLVTFLAPVRIPSSPVLIDGGGKTDWIVLDTRLDTHLAQRALAMPTAPRRHLEQIAATGARFDAFLIGHELAPGTVAAADTKDEHDDIAFFLGDPPTDPRAAKAVKAVRTGIEGLKWTAASFGRAGAGVLRAADAVLDPVILGLVTADGTARPGTRAALFHLVHWS